jgi:Na+-driven multidrug efflux pump
MAADEPPTDPPLSVSSDPCSTDSLPAESAPDTPPTPEIGEEAYRLGGRPPLPTLIVLSVGPLISQITGSLYPIVNSVWVAQTLGDTGITAVATFLNFDAISRGFAFFLQVGASSRISQLFGAGKPAEAGQVFCDLLRLTLVCEALVACFLPLTKIAARWFEAAPDIIELGYKYISPNLLGGFVPCLFLFCCGCLQAEGRSWLFMGVQICSMVLNMLVFSPFFLFLCKTGIAGVSYSGLAADFIPGVILVVLFFRGKFGVKPQLSGLLKKFSPETWTAVKIGLAQLIYQLSLALPGVFVRKFMGAAAGDKQTFNDALAGFNAFCRYWNLVICVTNAITIGFLPAASYACGAKRFKRILMLLIHAFWMAIAWSTFSMIFTVGLPRALCRIFSDSEAVLNWGVSIMRTGHMVSFVMPAQLIINSLLQALQLGGLSTVLCVATQTIPLPCIAAAVFYTDKTNLDRLFYCYPIQYVVSACIAIPFGIYGVRLIWKRPDDVNADEVPLDDIDDETRERLLGDTSAI